jgi:carbonyl reductase 1
LDLSLKPVTTCFLTQTYAGIAYKGNTFGADEASTTIATNFLGTKAACEALLPSMTQPGGRIVNVSST